MPLYKNYGKPKKQSPAPLKSGNFLKDVFLLKKWHAVAQKRYVSGPCGLLDLA